MKHIHLNFTEELLIKRYISRLTKVPADCIVAIQIKEIDGAKEIWLTVRGRRELSEKAMERLGAGFVSTDIEKTDQNHGDLCMHKFMAYKVLTNILGFLMIQVQQAKSIFEELKDFTD